MKYYSVHNDPPLWNESILFSPWPSSPFQSKLEQNLLPRVLLKRLPTWRPSLQSTRNNCCLFGLAGYRLLTCLLVLLLIGHIVRKWWWLSRNLLTKNASMFSPKWPNGSYIHTMYMLPLIISMQLPIRKIIRSYVYFLLNTTYIPGFGVLNTINTISHRDIDLNFWVFK